MKEFEPGFFEKALIRSLTAINENWCKINFTEVDSGVKHYEAWRCYDERAGAMLEWCDKNCGEYCEFAGKFYFKEDKDAMLFALRWL